MNNTNNMKNKTANESIRMKKYIVEAPEPKEGQKVSTGGIREKGRMKAPFKNPIPYEESTDSTAEIVSKQEKYDVSTKTVNTFWLEVVKYSCEFFWTNFGETVARSWLQKKGQRIARAISEQPERLQEPNVIDVPEEDIRTVSVDDDQIIPFNANRAKKRAHGL